MNTPSNLLVLSHIKRTWLPYIQVHPECVSRDYFQVLKRFPKADPRSLRGLFINGMLQAAASVNTSKSPLFLELLLTAPWRRKGSGSRLLYQLVQESVNVGSEGAIALKAAPTAVDFYLKYGFEIIKPAEKPEWDTPMRLSVPAAQCLLRYAVVQPDGVKLPEDIKLCLPTFHRC